MGDKTIIDASYLRHEIWNDLERLDELPRGYDITPIHTRLAKHRAEFLDVLLFTAKARGCQVVSINNMELFTVDAPRERKQDHSWPVAWRLNDTIFGSSGCGNGRGKHSGQSFFHSSASRLLTIKEHGVYDLLNDRKLDMVPVTLNSSPAVIAELESIQRDP